MCVCVCVCRVQSHKTVNSWNFLTPSVAAACSSIPTHQHHINSERRRPQKTRDCWKLVVVCSLPFAPSASFPLSLSPGCADRTKKKKKETRWRREGGGQRSKTVDKKETSHGGSQALGGEGAAATLLVTANGCRVVATTPHPDTEYKLDHDMYENKFLEMMGYIMGCSCFSKGTYKVPTRVGARCWLSQGPTPGEASIWLSIINRLCLF